MRILRVLVILSSFWISLSWSQNYNDQAKKIDSEIKRIEKLQEKDRKNQKKVRQELKSAQQKLKSTDKRLANLNKDIQNQRDLVKQLENKSQKSQDLSNQTKAYLAALMIQHAKFQKPNFLQILLSNNDAQEYERQQTYLKYFGRSRQHQLDTLRVNLQTLEASSQEYADRQKQLSKQLIEQKKLKQTIAKENRNKNQLLKKLDSGIAENTSTIKKLKADKKRLAALIQRLEEQRKAKAQSNKQFIPAKGGFTKQKGRLILPVTGKIKVAFGQKQWPSGLSSNGLEVSASQAGNNNVRAIYEGRVIFSNWLKGFGNLIIIEHGGGYISLYGNNQVLNKKEGDIVAPREVIATYRQAKNQPNFYFEMRHKGKTINPKPWLR